ncbi:hypothetical protein ACFMQL_20265 [Nonomuraea fastidiosa]|uniref:hypothetical protein n=1 Tax=Nonomuraea fastidiosa TaxID=46173 RepID=UPI0036725547
MSNNIRPGDRLRITLTCEADELKHGNRLYILLPQPNGITRYIGDIPVDAQGVDVEVLTPQQWPPLLGDVWIDGKNVEWFAVRRYGSSREIAFVSTDGHFAPESPDDMLTIRGPWRLSSPGAERKWRDQEGEPPF